MLCGIKVRDIVSHFSIFETSNFLFVRKDFDMCHLHPRQEMKAFHTLLNFHYCPRNLILYVFTWNILSVSIFFGILSAVDVDRLLPYRYC